MAFFRTVPPRDRPLSRCQHPLHASGSGWQLAWWRARSCRHRYHYTKSHSLTRSSLTHSLTHCRIQRATPMMRRRPPQKQASRREEGNTENNSTRSHTRQAPPSTCRKEAATQRFTELARVLELLKHRNSNSLKFENSKI